MEQYTTLILIALMVMAFYFLIMRPQRKRQQQVQQTLGALEPGARVMLGSGLFGTVVGVGEKQVVLEISEGVELTVLKQAIAKVVSDADEDSEYTTFADEDEDEGDELSGSGDAALGTEPDGLEPERPYDSGSSEPGSPWGSDSRPSATS